MTGAPVGTPAPPVCFGAPTADPSLSSTEARTESVLDSEGSQNERWCRTAFLCNMVRIFFKISNVKLTSSPVRQSRVLGTVRAID